MCLSLYRGEHSIFQDKVRKAKKKILCWKIYDISGFPLSRRLRSPYKNQYVTGPGKVISNRKGTALTRLEIEGIQVCRGIHVYTKKEIAEIFISYISKYKKWINGVTVPTVTRGVLVPVWCDPKDFVAESFDENEAVFTKVTITKHAFKNAIK